MRKKNALLHLTVGILLAFYYFIPVYQTINHIFGWNWFSRWFIVWFPIMSFQACSILGYEFGYVIQTILWLLTWLIFYLILKKKS